MSRKVLTPAAEAKIKLDNVVEKFLGFSEPVLSATAWNCLSAGYDKKKTAEKLRALLEMSKAERLAENLMPLQDTVREALKGPSRKRFCDDAPEMIEEEKRPREGEKLTPEEIQNMMANAQKLIEERKKALQNMKTTGVAPSLIPANNDLVVRPPEKVIPPLMPPNSYPSYKTGMSDDKAKKIAMLQAQIKNKLNSGVLGFDASGLPLHKPTPLILDSEGRTVDSSGREVQLTHVVPTLKANIRAKKREEFKAQMNEKPLEDPFEATFFDPRLSLRPNVRNRKALKFHEPGKFQQMADRMRMKAQLAKLQGEISQIAKKTGITSATKLAQMAPKVHLVSEKIPDVEWWDAVILRDKTYGEPEETPIIKEEAITHLIEHPIQMKSQSTAQNKAVCLPVFLTKKERKKLRRQNRREAWKEEQEKIRLGLEPPPEPKLRISNLMRALGTEAVQDPTKMEAHVRAQMARRQKAHEDANAARKLTKSQRNEKRRRRLTEDVSYGVHAAVFRVRDLSNMTKKFKVEMNCKQLYMTGAVIMYKDCNVVIIEGGPKQIAKYKRLMINRIKWEEDIIKDADGKETPNNCALVWEGMKPQRNFGEIRFKICASEKLAREQLKKHGCEHYWDLAYSGTVLDTEEK